MKRGRKKRRGRPKGSKNKVIEISPIKKVKLKCKKCKKHWQIRTDNPEIYTPEVRKNWICPLCKQR